MTYHRRHVFSVLCASSVTAPSTLFPFLLLASIPPRPGKEYENCDCDALSAFFSRSLWCFPYSIISQIDVIIGVLKWKTRFSYSVPVC